MLKNTVFVYVTVSMYFCMCACVFPFLLLSPGSFVWFGISFIWCDIVQRMQDSMRFKISKIFSKALYWSAVKWEKAFILVTSKIWLLYEPFTIDAAVSSHFYSLFHYLFKTSESFIRNENILNSFMRTFVSFFLATFLCLLKPRFRSSLFHIPFCCCPVGKVPIKAVQLKGGQMKYQQ